MDELLLVAHAWRGADPETIRSEPPDGLAELAAVRRLANAIAPTQGARAAIFSTARILAPHGRYEHLPLRLAPVNITDIGVLAVTAAALAGEQPAAHIRLALEECARRAYGVATDQAREALAATAAHLAALLSLTPDRDTVYLSALIRHSADVDIVLSEAGEAAYQRYATRVSTAWSPGDPLHRWLY